MASHILTQETFNRLGDAGRLEVREQSGGHRVHVVNDLSPGGLSSILSQDCTGLSIGLFPGDWVAEMVPDFGPQIVIEDVEFLGRLLQGGSIARRTRTTWQSMIGFHYMPGGAHIVFVPAKVLIVQKKGEVVPLIPSGRVSRYALLLDDWP